MYAPRIVSTGQIFCFINSFIIMIKQKETMYKSDQLILIFKRTSDSLALYKIAG